MRKSPFLLALAAFAVLAVAAGIALGIMGRPTFFKGQSSSQGAWPTVIPADPQPRVDERVEQYRQKLQQAGLMGPLVVRIEGNPTLSPDALLIVVSNAWHSQTRQARLQAAQNLWAGWAAIASPSNLDQARIKLVDLNGNEVGGSRIIAGSMIWVQD